MILQIIALLFSFFALTRVVLRARDQKLTIVEAIFWNFIWIGLAVTAIFPDISVFIAKLLGIGRGVDFIVYSSIGLMFYLIFRLYIKLEDLEQEITKLVREISFIKKGK
jgi:small membrane protein